MIFVAMMAMWSIVISLGLVLHQPLLVVAGILGAAGTVVLALREE